MKYLSLSLLHTHTQTFEGFSCSWCGDAYHLGCFSEKLRDERCHMGPLRNVIIPPSWIIKLPQIEPVRLIVISLNKNNYIKI